MKNFWLIIFIVILYSISFGQDIRVRISNDTNYVKGISFVKMDSMYNFHFAFTSNNSNIITGIFTYKPVKWLDLPMPADRYYQYISGNKNLNNLIIDNTLRIWFYYPISDWTTKLAFHDGKKWIESGKSKIMPSYFISSIEKGLLRIYFDYYDLLEGDGLGRNNIIDTNISNPYRFSLYPIQPKMGELHASTPHCEASFLFDSLFIAASYTYKDGFLGTPYNDISYYENFRYKKQILLEWDSYYNIKSWRENKFICAGNTNNFAYIITEIRDKDNNSTLYSHNVYKVDTIIRKKWTAVFPIKATENIPEIKLSCNGNILAMVYLSNNLYNLKILKDTVWYKTKVINEDIQVTGKSETRVFIENDSLVWISYSGILNGRRHLFLQKVIPNWEIDHNATGIKDGETNAPEPDYALFQNYPNPFNSSTIITYEIKNNNEFVKLKIFDILGREIETLVNETKSAGIHRVNFTPSNKPSGVYFYELIAGKINIRKRMILLK